MNESTLGKHVQIRVSTRDKNVYKAAAIYDDRSLSNWFVTLGNKRLKEIEREKERAELQRQREDGVSPITMPDGSGVNPVPVWEVTSSENPVTPSRGEVIPGIPIVKE